MGSQNPQEIRGEPAADPVEQVSIAGRADKSAASAFGGHTQPHQRSPLPLPSQVLQSNHNARAAPAQLFTESFPEAEVYDPSSSGSFYAAQAVPQPDFAGRANALINASLGRTPDGMSVIDPDSILDESGRLYHGYKDGKYLLPNDAVCSPALHF